MSFSSPNRSSGLSRARMRGDAMTEKTTSSPLPAPLPVELDAAAEDSTIRPFHIDVPEEELVDLRRRIAATRWPENETVEDDSQRSLR